MGDPRAMRWPGIRHKIEAACFIQWPRFMGFWIEWRDWYFGHYLMVSFGWFAFKMGHGTYDA